MDFAGIFPFDFDSNLDELDYYSSQVDVLEIRQYGSALPNMHSFSQTPEGLKTWIKSTAPTTNENGEYLTFELRLILGPTSRGRMRLKRALKFPNELEDLPEDNTLPFSREVFKSIVEEFHLPFSTPWLFATESSHFQRWSGRTGGARDPVIGFTMWRSTRGVVAIDVKLSLSYDPKTGRTSGILLGCSKAQEFFIVKQLTRSASLARHPLFLPSVILSNHHEMLSDETERLWEQLLRVETVSGQTGAPVIRPQHYVTSSFPDNQKSILGVVQLAAAWESDTSALLLAADAVKDELLQIKHSTPGANQVMVDGVTAILAEHLQLLTRRSKVMLWDLQYINTRAQAQTTAIYNLLAKQDNQISQKIAAQSLDLAESSRRIAAAAKRDSSAMKAIALLTMVFLPGTYISTFFAAPVLDFSTSSKLPLARPTFWLYWTVTAPTTVAVVVSYFAYTALIDRRYRQEKERTLNLAENTDAQETSSS